MVKVEFASLPVQLLLLLLLQTSGKFFYSINKLIAILFSYQIVTVTIIIIIIQLQNQVQDLVEMTPTRPVIEHPHLQVLL